MSSFLSYGLSLILAYATDNVVLCLEIATLRRFSLVYYCTAAPQGSHRRRPSPRQLALVLSFPNHCPCHPPFLGARACSLQPALPTLPSSSWRKLSSYLRLWPMRFWMNFWTWAFPLILLYSLVNSPSECLWDLHQAKYNSFSSQPWDLSQGSEISLARYPGAPYPCPSVSSHQQQPLNEASTEVSSGTGGSSAPRASFPTSHWRLPCPRSLVSAPPYLSLRPTRCFTSCCT